VVTTSAERSRAVYRRTNYNRSNQLWRERGVGSCFGETIQKFSKLVDRRADLGASRSEIIEAILTAYVQSDVDRTARVWELTVRRQKEDL